MEDKSEFYVHRGDGQCRFRMVIRGDLGRVTVKMIRKFLRPQGITGEYELRYNGVLLLDDMKGRDFGLEKGAVIQLVIPTKSNMDGSGRDKNNPNNHHSNYCDNSRDGDVPGQGRDRPVSGSFSPQNSPKDSNSSKEFFENEKKKLKEEVHCLREQLQQLGAARDKAGPGVLAPYSGPTRRLVSSKNSPPSSGDIIYEKAAESVRLLGEELHLTNPPLQLGFDLTCSLGPPEMTIFITLDPSTERLYVYSTLLTALPDDDDLRRKLYEVILQGSLLSREVCGGGIGLSLDSNIVMLTTTLPLRFCGPEALKEVVPQFVVSVSRWRSVLNELFSV